ncbi:MAG TPA: hypothetical protein PK416_03070 [Thermodesulfobacteriota bacterium]|nr:hypothetical protein [Thermodesulfobacteriota bacterium]
MARPKRVFNFTTPRVHTTQIMNLSQTVQLTRLGKIRLGIRVPVTKDNKNANCRKANHPNEEMCNVCSRPVQTDHFVFDGPEDYPPGVYDALIKEYGEKPKSLQFWFTTENRALVFPQALKFYKGPRLWCRGDGNTATRVDEKTGGQFSVNCPCEYLGQGCSPRASLMIALYKIKVQGCFQIDTGSIHNIIRTNSFMNELGGDPAFPETVNQSLLRRISYVPLRLSLMPTLINMPEQKTGTKPLFVFTFDGDGRQAAQLRQRDAVAALLPGQSELSALPPAPDDRHDEVREAEPPNLNGNLLTPPDQAEPETVDLTTGEVTGGPTAASPVEAKPDPPPPYDRSKPAEPPAVGDVPFGDPADIDTGHEPTPPQQFAWQKNPPKDAGGLVMAANKITSRDEFDLFKKEFQPLIDQMRPGMKVAVENAISDKQANLF